MRFVPLDDATGDVQHAARGLRRDPGFTALAILTLAVGIGVNATVFTVTNAFLFKGFPRVARNDRILYISSRGYGCCASYPDFEDWRAQARSFAGMAAVHGVGAILADSNGFAERHDATEVTANTFELIGAAPALGRDFTDDDALPGAAPVAILSHGLWERRFGSDAAIVGRTIRINSVATTIVGVMPRGFSFPQKQDLWVPLVPTRELRKREARVLWFAFGRLAEGVTPDHARVEMQTIGKRLANAYPLTNQDQLPVVQTFREFFIGPNATAIYGSMWAAVLLVLLIACANLANLTLARSIGRSREIAVRIALGAGRWRIVRQLLIESVMLSAAGGVLGWYAANWGVRAYALAMAYKSPWLVVDYAMDRLVLGYLVALSIGTALLFGLVPAFRLSHADLTTGLKDGGQASTRGGQHLSSALVVAEMAVAVVLLAGAGVMIRSFLKVYTTDVGVDTANVLTADVNLPAARYPDADAQISFFERLLTRLEGVPGVESAAVATTIPTHGSMKIPFERAGAAPVAEQRRPKLSALIISVNYFRTLGVAVLSGRAFNDFDGPSGLPVAIVNRAFASAAWPGEDPLGKRIRLFDGTTRGRWLTVVGVVPNIVQNGITRQEHDPLVYLPYLQTPATQAMWVLARTRVPPERIAADFRRLVQALDSDLPIFGPFPLAERLGAWNYWPSGINGAAFVIFAVIAVLLASLGLYAVIAHSVTQRTREIGVRIALGGTARDILALVFRQGMRSVGIGVAIGLAASFALTPILRSALIQVSPADPASFLLGPLVLSATAALGCVLPARAAMRVDPAVALRHE